ncbi:MAG: M6 family metalloprotease domain-containing protein [Ignavibacteria bacterium]|nr:M6 family metalloprotease domain-containing protein [Ignavibacteria bacterium]
MKHNIILKLTLFILLTTTALAVPALNQFVSITLPDSSVVSVKPCGDEYVNWFESPEGYTLLRDANNFFVYAALDETGDMTASSMRYLPKSDAKIQKHLHYSKSQIERKIKEATPVINASALDKLNDKLQDAESIKIKGKRKYLVVLMGYPDFPFERTAEEYAKVFNEPGFAGARGFGSVRDYYLENSYGQYEAEFDVIGPFTAAEKMSYYAYSQQSGQSATRYLILEAIEEAKAAGIDFSQYDNTKDGFVDAIIVIHAGYDYAVGASNSIWSHNSIVFNDNLQLVVANGKYIYRYATFPELKGTSGHQLCGIGVVCHEFGHTLGAPDYYDTDYGENGYFQGAGNWCLMASGSNNNQGDCPPSVNMFQKIMWGWATPTILTTASKQITNIPPAAHSPVAYRIDTDTENEYYILENRQQVGYDQYLPWHGLIIWHVHKNMEGAVIDFHNPGVANDVNSKHPQMLYPVCAGSTYAVPNATPSSYGAINSPYTPYPGINNNHTFTDNSTPSAKGWDGRETSRPITNITEVDTFINFNYTGRPSALFQVPYKYDFSEAYNYSHYKSVSSSEFIGWKRFQDDYGNWMAYLLVPSSYDISDQWHYLFLPAIAMYTDYTYKFKFLVKARDERFDGNLQVLLGFTNSAEEDRIELLNLPKFNNTVFQEYEVHFSVPSSGIYYLAFLSESCGETMDVYVDNLNVDAMVGMDDASDDNDVYIFPNPAESTLSITHSDNITINDIRVTNATGDVLFQTKYSDNSINISNLPTGAYYIILETSAGSKLRSFIKK